MKTMELLVQGISLTDEASGNVSNDGCSILLVFHETRTVAISTAI
jgi:hypothetical protein